MTHKPFPKWVRNLAIVIAVLTVFEMVPALLSKYSSYLNTLNPGGKATIRNVIDGNYRFW